MTSFKSWTSGGGGSSLFELKGGIISSKQSKPMDIRNYIRADRFYTRSDIRLKSNIEDLTDDDLDKLKKVVPKSYKFQNDNEKKIFNISDKSVALIIKKYAEKAGLDASRYAGHSLRSGFATTAAEFGAEERNIMAMTGHKTTQMVRRYIKEANIFKNNALNKIKI